MISEIVIGEVSAEYVSHATFVAKINELIRAQNAKELAATDSQQLKPNMPTLAEVQRAFALDAEDTGDPTMDEQAAIRFAYDYISRHVGH